MSITDKDRERAASIVANWRLHFDADQDTPLENMIMTYLADERDAAQAPFLALAETFENYARSDQNEAETAFFGDRDYWVSSAGTWASAAAEIRQVAKAPAEVSRP